MGLWVGRLAGDQGPGFNPDSVLLSSERFPCLPLCCLFGWAVLEGGLCPSWGAAGPSWGAGLWCWGSPSLRPGPSEQGALARAASGGSCCAGRFSCFTDSSGVPRREAGQQQLSRGRPRVPQAPLSSWGTSMGTGRHLTSLF